MSPLSSRAEAMRQASENASRAVAALEGAALEGAALDESLALDDHFTVGDVVVDARSARDGVQWAFVSDDGDRVCLVPADAVVASGPRDMAVREVVSDSRLVLRPDHALWLDTTDWRAHLADARRCGRLHLEDCARAVTRARDAESRPAPEDEVLSSDRDHRVWIADVIEPLVDVTARRGALQESVPKSADNARVAVMSTRTSSAQVPPQRALRPGFGAWAVAAALLTGIGVGWLAHRSTTGEPSVSTSSPQPRAVVAEDARALPMAFPQPVEALRGDAESGADDAVVNLESAAEQLGIAVALDPLTLAPRYRVEIVDAAGNLVVDALEWMRGDRLVISLTVPADAFPSGVYRVRVQPLAASGDGENEARRYGFSVVSSPAALPAPLPVPSSAAESP